MDTLSGSVGGWFALALSARSNVLQEFEAVPARSAYTVSSDSAAFWAARYSHGCVRLSDRSIRWLAARIGPGVPTTVVTGPRLSVRHL